MATKEATKQYQWIPPTDVGKKKKESKYFLGRLTRHNIIDQEDSVFQSTAVWRDPFRMSVLDFQRSALDKLVEVLKIPIKFATEKGLLKDTPPKREACKSKEPLEDLQFYLKHIKVHKATYETLFGQSDKPIDAIDKKCDMLITARNLTAHQAYIKDDITPPHNPSKPSKNRLGAGHVPLSMTKTFEHTKDVVVTCLEFAEKVLEGMEKVKQTVTDELREVRDRVENLQLLKEEFMEFIEYRDLERHNLETFHGDKMSVEEQREAAMDLLDALKERVEKGEDDITKLLICVVAPRCCAKLETQQTS